MVERGPGSILRPTQDNASSTVNESDWLLLGVFTLIWYLLTLYAPTVKKMKFLFTSSLFSVPTFRWWEERKWSPRILIIQIQIELLTSSIRNVWRTVRRICIFTSGLKGLNYNILFHSTLDQSLTWQLHCQWTPESTLMYLVHLLYYPVKRWALQDKIMLFQQLCHHQEVVIPAAV